MTEATARTHITTVEHSMEVTLKTENRVITAAVVQLLSHVLLFVTLWTAANLALTHSRRLPELMSIASVMPSSHLILCCPLLLLPSIFPSIRDFSNESAVLIR